MFYHQFLVYPKVGRCGDCGSWAVIAAGEDQHWRLLDCQQIHRGQNTQCGWAVWFQHWHLCGDSPRPYQRCWVLNVWFLKVSVLKVFWILKINPARSSCLTDRKHPLAHDRGQVFALYDIAVGREEHHHNCWLALRCHKDSGRHGDQVDWPLCHHQNEGLCAFLNMLLLRFFGSKFYTSLVLFPIFSSLLQVAGDGSQVPMTYRYKITPDAKVNSFKPKELSPQDDKSNLRSAVFGALWCNKFNQLPKTAHCDVVWEACMGRISLMIQRYKVIYVYIYPCLFEPIFGTI